MKSENELEDRIPATATSNQPHSNNMYYTNIKQPLNTHTIFSAGIRMFEYLKLSLKPGVYKNTDNKEWLTYLLHATSPNLTVVDVGSHKREYLFDMIKVSKHAEKLIAFECDAAIYNYLNKMKHWLKLRNVAIETLSLPARQHTSTENDRKKNEATIAPVINLKQRINSNRKARPAYTSLDNYFLATGIQPGLLKIKTDGNELDILKGSIKTLELYKPKILLECRETQRSRDRLLSTFKFLTDLHYHGYFILDTMKIPLANFDFNIYQNEIYGFYCNNFLFE